MRCLSVRGGLLACAVLWLEGCSYLTSGSMTPAMAARPASYYANPGLMALTPYTVFRDQTGFLSLQAETGKDVPWQTASRQVTGRSCQYGLQIPLGVFGADRDAKTAFAASAGWGEGGASSALEDASRGLSVGDTLFDIRVDLNTVTILGIWREACVVVNARVAPAVRKASTANVLQSQHS